MSLEQRLTVASKRFQTIQDDLDRAVEARQRLESQLTENEQVKKEFSKLSPEDGVYKLLGPALLKQDQAEAKSNVDKRIEFIQAEIEKAEKQLKDLGEKGEAAKMEILAIQDEAQRTAAASATGVKPPESAELAA